MPSSNKAPYPVCISIRNFFPPSILKSPTDQHAESKATSCMNRNESIDFPPCQLDIIERDGKSKDSIRIICSLSSRGAQPHWNHLDEQIDQHALEDSILYARFTIHNNLIEVPLHPSKLKPISQSDNITIPESLPPNAILIHYDDARTRVMPSLYSLLVKRNVIQEYVEVEKGEVFSEKAFDVLGDVDDENSSDEKEISVAAANTDSIYDDKVFDLLGDKTAAGGNPSTNEAVAVGANDESFKHRTTLNAINTSTRNDSQFELTDKFSLSAASPGQSLPLDSPPFTSESDEVSMMQRKVSELRQRVQQNQDLLKREEMTIYKETSDLKSIIEQVQQLQRETSEIVGKTGTER
ncbi:hypothetical protein ACHAWO_012495 [Cyclotella atomus]|uniref:Centrosomal protein of 19 kDa n=1 Tax=Cyclotella atomus TaxID=382360 RepID=A0ABD3NE08_9STRA